MTLQDAGPNCELFVATRVVREGIAAVASQAYVKRDAICDGPSYQRLLQSLRRVIGQVSFKDRKLEVLGTRRLPSSLQFHIVMTAAA